MRERKFYSKTEIDSNQTYHRTGMRIGVSSLSRPGSGAQKNLTNLLRQNGCIHSAGLSGQQHQQQWYPLNNSVTNHLHFAGSEPNLYQFGQLNPPQQQQQKPKVIEKITAFFK